MTRYKHRLKILSESIYDIDQPWSRADQDIWRPGATVSSVGPIP